MYRYRHYRRFRYRRRSSVPGGALVIIIAVLAALAAGGGARGSGVRGSRPHRSPGRSAALAIAFAQGELGKPYLWGGTGPDAFDCSGLVQAAYQAAGVRDIPRTSQEQWAWGPQETTPQAGDLVFFAGSDGTAAAPGHVGIVIDPKRHRMIEAYATGFPVRVSVYGLPGAAPGDSPVIGFTAPWERAGAA